MRDVLRLSVPLALWLAGFSAVYGLQGLACSRHWPEDLAARPTLIAAWLLAVALQATALWLVARDPSPSPTLRAIGLGLAATALAAAIWTLAPVAATTICA